MARYQFRKIIRIGSWNVQTINGNPSRSWRTLAKELQKFKIDLAAIQETKSKRCTESNINDYKLLQSPSEYGKGGLAFMVHKKYEHLTSGWNPISFRLSSLNMRTANDSLSFINVYAPGQCNPVEEKDLFYEDLNKLYNSLRRRNKIFLIGDFNSHVGKDSLKWPGTIGNYGLPGINSNGVRLLSFCRKNDLHIMNTYFKHENRHKVTWKKNNDSLGYMIDFFIAPARFHSCVFDVRSFRSAAFNSDHNLLVAQLKMLQTDFRN